MDSPSRSWSPQIPPRFGAQHAPGAQPFQQLDGCTYKPQRRNDGDSFYVILPDKKELIFSAHVFDAPGRAPLFL
jgi:hypothetical protein